MPAKAPAKFDRIRFLPISALRLDTDNPRLPESERTRSQEELISVMARDYSLSELGRSIAEHGYFLEEPLAAVKNPGDEHTVVEGNRRLAALKLLGDPTLRSRVSADTGMRMEEWGQIATKANKHNLKSVPVIVYDSKEELLPFMGFRHITGVKAWEPIAKARFIDRLINQHNMSFKDAARTVGSQSNPVRRQHIAYRAFLQARDHYEFDVERVQRNYSLFEKALGNPSLRDFLGISATKEETEDPRKTQSPVPRAKAENLRELIGWLGGEGKLLPVITDSRQIKELGEVVASEPARAHLRASRNLVGAVQLAGGEERRLVDNLNKAFMHLTESLKDAHRFRSSRTVDAAFQKCRETVEELTRTFKKR